jgi:hypothetical protein
MHILHYMYHPPPGSEAGILKWSPFVTPYEDLVSNFYSYKCCYSDSPEPLSRNESGRFVALKFDSTHHFFRNAWTKSGSSLPGGG